MKTALAGLLLFAGSAAALAQDPARQAFDAGVAFDLGHGGEPDPVRAREEYAIAASTGLPDAEFNLAVMLDSGIGAAVDRSGAALWYARAASHGVGRAAFDLGGLLRRGDGVPANPVLARRWFRVAGEDGIRAANEERVSGGKGSEASGPITLVAPRPDPPQLARGSATPSVELSWTVPAMPEDGTFFVEIAPLRPDGRPGNATWREVPVSALLVDLPQGGGREVWRVYLASRSAGHYVATDWQKLPTGGAPS